jgi:hypothetical protein
LQLVWLRRIGRWLRALMLAAALMDVGAVLAKSNPPSCAQDAAWNFAKWKFDLPDQQVTHSFGYGARQ